MRAFDTGCMVPDCPGDRMTRLGVCADHWRALPLSYRRQWWEAWAVDSRTAVWLTTRRACLQWLAAHGA